VVVTSIATGVMMRFLRLLPILVALGATPARAQDTAAVRDTLAYATAPLTIREKPFANARALGRIAAGSAVRLYSCSAGWCRVAAPRLTGYALEEYFSRAPAPSDSAQGKGYINSQGERVPSPMRTPNDSPPPGASAHCRDGTYSFSRTRRGTCSHHGGVARWLP